MAVVGDLIDVDDDVEELRRLDRAKILIRTPWRSLFHHTVTVKIGGEVHNVYIIEEGLSDVGTRTYLDQRATDSSEDIESDDNDSDSLFTERHQPISSGTHQTASTATRRMSPTANSSCFYPKVLEPGRTQWVMHNEAGHKYPISTIVRRQTWK